MSAGLAVVAAGSSTRLGEDKILVELGGHPVLRWSLAAAEASGAFDEIVVVGPAARVERLAAVARSCSPRARVVVGGATRTESSWAGLDALANVDVVAIHDGARPFVAPSLFARLVEEAAREGSAVAGLPLAETVRRADEAGVTKAEIEREGLWSAQTPQVFQRDLLLRARATVGERSFTDDAAALVAAGLPVRMSLGDRFNVKITTLEDLDYARELVRNRVVALAAAPARPAALP